MEGVFRFVDGSYPEWSKWGVYTLPIVQWTRPEPNGRAGENCAGAYQAVPNEAWDGDCTWQLPFACEIQLGKA